MDIGDKIKKLRKKFNMTQEELAQRLGYSSKNVSKWENNYSIPDYHTLKEICKVFNIDFIDLEDLEIITNNNYNCNQNVNISSKAIEIFEYMIEANGAIKIEHSEDNLLALEELVYEEVLLNYSTICNEENIIVKYSLNKFFNDDKSLYDYFLYKNYKNINFANDKEYSEFIQKLNLSPQIKFVLDTIESLQKIHFKTSDIYTEELINKIRKTYKNNTDVKKTIRNSLSELCKLGVVDKQGYNSYVKKHHNMQMDYGIRIDNKILDNLLMIDFNTECFEADYYFNDFEKIISNRVDIVKNIFEYLIEMRNLSLIKEFLLKFKTDYEIMDFIKSEHIVYEEIDADFKLIILS